ncbi:phosphoenolpyruvate--protein phosphotransferase [uncultured Desulfovibrio sp.]|uniref:phosphoenolpyruvate--protein phosphotransferase n=1 Tax=uncultured Desulfovibrio sp. TaxID=167968 RepID=UPI00260C5471|nr:phosphoenolpyruvate--protein phosphotransferase [uncultured Desulfovibrio sp.]
MARAVLFGTPVSPGIGIGSIRFMHDMRMSEKRRIGPDEVETERYALRAAAASVRSALEKTMRNVPEDLAEYRDVIAAQMELARDPRLLDAALVRIEHKKICASWALNHTVEELCALFQGMDDPYLRDRTQDIRAVGLRLRECLSGAQHDNAVSAPSVLVAEDLSPADVMELNLEGVLGILTAEGGPTSHTAILSRGLHIPALVGVTGLLNTAREDERIILDGLGGCVLFGPDESDLSRYTARRDEFNAWESHTRHTAHWPAEMCDGVRVAVQANLESLEELGSLPECGADGVGLYRTEFAYLKGDLPTEEELFREYAAVAAKSGPGRVVFRTLDAGADKMLRAQAALKEPNPALGLRGIRFSLRHQGIFRTQLRALLRAGAAGNLALLLPMISGLAEVQGVRRILQELRQELHAQNLPHASDLPLGIMVETPAAVMVCDALARECDFFSIGTNDLIHYLMAIDRNNRHVGYLHEPLHPAVVRSLKQVIDAAHREGIGVSVCGELASDPCGLALLLGMGVDAVSAAPRFVPGMKHMIRQLDAETCMDLAHSVLMSTDVMASRRMVREKLHQSLGTELAFHTTSLSSHSQP